MAQMSVDRKALRIVTFEVTDRKTYLMPQGLNSGFSRESVFMAALRTDERIQRAVRRCDA